MNRTVIIMFHSYVLHRANEENKIGSRPVLMTFEEKDTFLQRGHAL